MVIKSIKTRIFKEGEDLPSFIEHYLNKPKENSIIVITSKIIALSENRTAVVKTKKDKTKLVRQESQLAIKTKYVWLTIKDGQVMAAAGIDESNANGKLILLPKDSFLTAKKLLKCLRLKYKLKKLGVLITDSRTMPLRLGITGMALGYAGFKGSRDYRGKFDIFGRRFKFSCVNLADSLAAAAVLVMGEGKERQPLAVIEDAPIKFCGKINRYELKIKIREDMYRPLFLKLKNKNGLIKKIEV